MNYCGKCGQELKDIHLNGNCPGCGINLINHKDILKQAIKGFAKIQRERSKAQNLEALDELEEDENNSIKVHLFGGPQDGKAVDGCKRIKEIHFPIFRKESRIYDRIIYKIEQDPDIKDLFYGIYQE